MIEKEAIDKSNKYEQEILEKLQKEKEDRKKNQEEEYK